MSRLTVIGLIVTCCGVLAMPVSAQRSSAPSASAIMQNVEKGFAEVQDFVATVEAEVDMERVRVPKMTATLYFKKPDRVHIASPGFAMLPREGMVLNPSVLRQRYDASIRGKESIEGKELYKLELVGKDARVRPKQLLLWIDPANWTIAKMESAPYQGRSLRLDITYAQRGENIWLPQMLTASFDAPALDTTIAQLDLDLQGAPRTEERRRPPRSGKIIVRYLEYKVNVGLSDEVFEKREAVPK
jgi:outer membrane lipoprotein-sorting protein